MVAFLSNEDNSFIDPDTDELWKYPVPESCLPSAAGREELANQISQALKIINESWEPAWGKILSERRVEAKTEEGFMDAQGMKDSLLLYECWFSLTRSIEARMRMMNQAADNSITMSNMTANMVGNMSLAWRGSRQAAWNALQYRQNIDQMGMVNSIKVLKVFADVA